jgi:hypothetical protein
VAEARCWFFLAGLPRQIGKIARTDGWASEGGARTCMTVWGARPAGPVPMRMSAVAVGETSSGMVVEWSARSRIEHSLGDWLKILLFQRGDFALMKICDPRDFSLKMGLVFCVC